MTNRVGLLIVTTSALTLAFLLACISTGTNQWITIEQTGKNPKIIYLKAEQGLFERCMHTKYRSRQISNNCFGLSDAYDGKKQDTWEKAVAGLMVTSTVIMGIAAVFSGFLMVSESPRTGILSDVVPVLSGNVAALLSIIALAIYNSKFEMTRTKLVGAVSTTYTESEVDFGYSLRGLAGLDRAFVYYLLLLHISSMGEKISRGKK